jgi:hypothetical protein
MTAQPSLPGWLGGLCEPLAAKQPEP